jgi:Transcriptional regulatory protein, C terminal/FHA domain
MELREQAAVVVVRRPDGSTIADVPLTGPRVSVGRLPEANDIALEPDPQLLVTRAAHCTFEREGSHWAVIDGGSVNGTFLKRDRELQRVENCAALHEGDVVCVLGSVDESGERRYFELVFHASADSQGTRAVPLMAQSEDCLSYDADEARLVLVHGGERHELEIRAQAHKLVRYMAERNEAAGAPALCTHAELMHAVWGDEPMHSREELAKLVWELRKKLEPFGAEHLIENVRRLGYRMRTCPGR